jgi:peptide/nickel transport system permease protein
MIVFLARRLAVSLLVMLLVSFLTFGIIWLVPGDAASAFLDTSATPEQLQQIRHQLGLDQPFYEQMLSWYAHLLHGDLGNSIFLRRSVVAAIIERLPVTLSLTTIALTLATVLGVAAGVLAALRHGHWSDQALSSLALLGLSVPEFWLGLMLIYLFAVGLGWFPTGGYVSFSESVTGWLFSLALPSLTLAAGSIGFIARMTRSAMLEVLSQDFIRTADAKGLSRIYVVAHHGLPNALIPIVTVVGIIAGGLLGGAIVVEQVFSLPGVGRLLIGAILSRDIPLIQGGLLMVAFVFLLVNLVVDCTYARVDPRVRLG